MLGRTLKPWRVSGWPPNVRIGHRGPDVGLECRGGERREWGDQGGTCLSCPFSDLLFSDLTFNLPGCSRWLFKKTLFLVKTLLGGMEASTIFLPGHSLQGAYLRRPSDV